VEPPIANDDPAGQEGPRPENGRLQTAAAMQVSTVKEVLASRQDDQDVVLRGRIVRHLRGEGYILAGATGEIDSDRDDGGIARERIPRDSGVESRGEGGLERNEVAVEVDEIMEAAARPR